MARIFRGLYWFAKGVKVFALVGESGTGKSFRAKLVAQKYGIELIVDDGLLIRGDTILAGKSAKKEPVFMKAVKVALFDDKDHRDSVVRILHGERFRRILVIGTSVKMAYRISERLGIPHPIKIIKIEDIASQEEIEKAIRSRRVEGKHVIPVPALEVKRSYPQIFYDSVRVFLQKNFGAVSAKPRVYEKTVVRPEYTKRGRVSISENALSQMIVHCVDEYNDGIRVSKINVKSDTHGYRITVFIELPYRTKLTGHIHKLQEFIIDNIERYTGVLIEEVNIVIDKYSP
jgi:hypothetical protein